MEFIDIYFYLMIIFAIQLGILTVHLLIKAPKSEDRRKKYYYSIAVFSGFYLICRIMLTLNDALGYERYSIIYVWATFFVLVGFAGLMYSVEKFIYSKLKFVPTIGILFFAALVLIYPRSGDTNMVTYWSFAGAAFGILIPFLYLYVGFKSAGNLRTTSFIIAIGTIIFVLGKGLNTRAIQDIVPILYVIAPTLMIVGLIIFHYGIMKPIT